MKNADKQELRGLGNELAVSILTLGMREFIAWIKRRRAAKRAKRG